MITRRFNILLVLAMMFVGMVSCQPEDPIGEPSDDQIEEPTDKPTDEPSDEPEDGPEDGPSDEPEDELSLVSNVYNPNAEKLVSYRGETITIKFDAIASWSAYLVLQTDPEGEWVAITSKTEGAAKNGCSVRLAFEKNKTEIDRIVELWVEGEGYDAQCIATLTQAASGTSSGAKLNEALNKYMHNILQEDYLFKDEYNALEVDLTVNFTDFLNTHLLALGDVNDEDGGYYKMHQANPGERYIYTNIAEVQYLKTKAASAAGFGFGPFMSTALDNSSNPIMGIFPGFVRPGSPAEKAGLRRGDVIFAVNGTTLSKETYMNYMSALYLNQSGSYKFTYLRDVDGSGNFQEFETDAVTAGVYTYNPVIHKSIIPGTSIGYLVYESFDYDSQEFLKEAVNWLKSSGVTELVLDLRFNNGGSVAQSRWLAGCIAGSSNGSKTFTKAVYHDGSEEVWTFDYGYSNDVDNLGLPIDLGLNRVYVICSYNTASAAELVITSLKGIDFDVRTIGGRTEGKNVGMTVSETTVDGRRFQFSPVTFRLQNAKGWGDYADGIDPDAVVNNDNGVMTDDYAYLFPFAFADWGDIAHQSALQVAVLDILAAEASAANSMKSAKTPCFAPVSVQPMKMEHGRYGNLVYEIN